MGQLERTCASASDVRAVFHARYFQKNKDSVGLPLDSSLFSYGFDCLWIVFHFWVVTEFAVDSSAVAEGVIHHPDLVCKGHIPTISSKMQGS